MERYSRRWSVRVKGIPEERGNQTENCIQKLVEYMDRQQIVNQLPSLDLGKEIEIAHRVGPKREGVPRQIIARFNNRSVRDRVLRAARGKGRDGGTDIFEDLCKTDYQMKKAAVPQIRKAYSEGKRARFQRGKLIIDGQEVNIDNQ